MKLKSNQPRAIPKQVIRDIRRATWSDRYLSADHNNTNIGSDGSVVYLSDTLELITTRTNSVSVRPAVYVIEI